MRNKVMRALLILSIVLFTSAAFAADLPEGKRIVVDQLGRSVVIPKKVTRVVCLMHHALDITELARFIRQLKSCLRLEL